MPLSDDAAIARQNPYRHNANYNAPPDDSPWRHLLNRPRWKRRVTSGQVPKPVRQSQLFDRIMDAVAHAHPAIGNSAISHRP